jgi:GT2 family glycosyltransferase
MNHPSKFFSVIIPTYNRPDRVKECLASLLQLDYRRDRMEIIIVDDGSKTRLDEIISPYQNQINITLIRQENSGPAQARNLGAFTAKGEFLAFTDDDCTPTSDWLTQLELQFNKQPDCLIGGAIINALTDNIYTTASQEIINYLYSYYNANPEDARFFTSNNFALAKELFIKIGGFDTSFPLAAGEDREFCDRWLHLGYKMIYATDVKVEHAHELNLKKFWKQQFNYGLGAFYFQRITTKRRGKRFQKFSFYLNLLKYPFSQSLNHSAWLIASLFLLSQVAIAAGLFSAKIKKLFS